MRTFHLLVCLLAGLRFGLASSSRPRCHGGSACDPAGRCDCSAQRLTRVPSAPMRLTAELDLSSNALQVIMDDEFQEYVSLNSLILRKNRIKRMQEQAFSPLVNLEKLDLSFNKLTTLSPEWFEKLASLRHLNILENEYKTLGPFSLFQPLKRLRTLRFGGPYLQSVKINDFVGLSGLDELVIHEDNLQDYERGSLSRIGSVSRVTLALNGLFQNNQDVAKVLLADILQPNTTLTFTNTKFHKEQQMSPFQEVNVKDVKSVTFKNVSVTDEAFFACLKELSGSKIASFVVEDSEYFLTGIWPNFMYHLEHLEEFVLKNIEIPQFYGFPAIFIPEHLLRSFRRFSAVDTWVHTFPCDTAKDVPLLEYIDVSGNLLNDQKMREMMCDGTGVFRALRTLNVSRNNLQSLSSHLFTNLEMLENIDMSGNTFHSMPEEQACGWPPNVRLLNLSSSHLSKATVCLPRSLHVLDLSNNLLTTINVELPLLRALYISGNKIANLPDGSLYPELLFLFIRQNVFHAFGDSDLQAYSELKSMEAGSDTFICSCKFVTFMARDSARRKVMLADGLESYVCESPDHARGQRVAEITLSAFECHASLALSGLCLSILLVCALVAGLCHRFNTLWYLRMMWAWLRAKRRPAPKRGDLRYDAFVSYSETDSGWVDQHLVPELEGSEPPLRLCLHKRDFLPGPWMDSIADAIEKSRRTLFVLSRHFVQNEWCKYGLDFSHFRLFEHNDDSAVLVLLEPIAQENIPRRFCKLRKVMNRRTYLEWPNDDHLVDRFWQKLREAINGP